MGRKGYYEIEILETDTFSPRYGFVSSAFTCVWGSSEDKVGDDEHSWAVDGENQKAWYQGKHESYRRDINKWKKGDRVGLACDLDGMQVLVSVNGSFESPNGLVFKLTPGAVQGGLFAAFTGSTGVLRYNLGQAPFTYAPPSSDYIGFSSSLMSWAP
jgi:hypothetical protein